MNNNCPYTIAIRQFICQGYIDKVLDNVYSNVVPVTTFSVSFGYTVTVIQADIKNCSIKISNPMFMPDITFNIPNGGFKEFDLISECATFRIRIGAKLGPGVNVCNVS